MNSTKQAARIAGLIALLIVIASSAPLRGEGQAPAAPETVVVQNGTLSLHGLLYHPAGKGPFPAVLFNHGSGPDPDPGNPASLGPVFARHGYLFLYLYRRGAGLSADQGTDSVTLMNRAFVEKGQEGLNEVQLQLLKTELTDVQAGLAFLRAHSQVNARRLAVAGHSFGGQLALLVPERDSRLRAVVAFAPAAVSWDESPKLRSKLLAAVGHTSVPVFFVYAENDYSVSPGKAMAAEMTRLGKSNQIKIYPAVGQTPDEGHDFVHLGVPTWEPDVFAFLDERMKP